MKIILFSPITQTAAAAQLADRLLAPLQSLGHTLVRVNTEAAAGNVIEDAGAARAGAPLDWRARAVLAHEAVQADLVVYLVGPEPDLYAAAHAWLPALPGLVCLLAPQAGAALCPHALGVLAADATLDVALATCAGPVERADFDGAPSELANKLLATGTRAMRSQAILIAAARLGALLGQWNADPATLASEYLSAPLALFQPP